MLDISELSRQSGFAASKLRYYEEVGLIRSAGRKGLKRLYAEEVKTRLAIIKLGQVAGFSLAEIRAVIGAEGQPDLDRGMLAQKAEEIDRQIRHLTDLRDGLRHIQRCSAERHLECPKFQRILRITLNKGAKG